MKDKKQKNESQEELRRQLQLTKTITDNAASCLFMMDMKGYPTFMNPAAEKVTGYTLDKIKDKPLHDSVHFKYPDGRPYPMSECPIDNAQADLTEMKNYEDVLTKKDGTLYPVMCYLAPLAIDGKVFGSVLEFRDTTKEKEAEEALWESQQRYRALVKNTVFGVTIIDTDYKMIMANAIIAKLFNKPQSYFVGKNCFREYEKREAVCPHCPGARAMASGKTEEVETQGVREDGSRFYVRNRAIPFVGPDGAVKGFIELIEDIDARKKLEEKNTKYTRELEVFYKAGTGREARILELKKEVEMLKKELGK
ncbi:MAG: PAS domain-containing protein [Candidatus Omnitrophota bacterium]